MIPKFGLPSFWKKVQKSPKSRQILTASLQRAQTNWASRTRTRCRNRHRLHSQSQTFAHMLLVGYWRLISRISNIMTRAWPVLIVFIVAYVECLPLVSRFSAPSTRIGLNVLPRPILRCYGGQPLDEDHADCVGGSLEAAENTSLQEVVDLMESLDVGFIYVFALRNQFETIVSKVRLLRQNTQT